MITQIEVEGMDKTGKDTLVGYLDYMSGRTISVHSRGLMSVMAYNKVFERGWDMSDMIPYHAGTLIVLLDCDDNDLEIRCKMTREVPFDVKKHREAFEETADMFEKAGIEVLKFDTSAETPYDIAKQVLAVVNRINARHRGE